MDFIKDIAKAAVDSVNADMGSDTRAIGDIPILAKLVDFFLESAKGDLREVVQKEVTKCRDLTVQGIASAIKDIFEIVSKIMNGQLDLTGADGVKIFNIAAQILGGNKISTPSVTSSNNNNANNNIQSYQFQQAPQQQQQNYQQQPQQNYQQQPQQNYQQQPQQQYGYQPQQQQGGYQQQQQGGAYQGQQSTGAYQGQQSTGAYQGQGRGVNGDDRGILEDIGNFVKTEIQDMANGTDSNNFNLNNILNSGIDANNLREAATPLISESFKGLMEKAENGVTDLITNGVIDGVKSYLKINTKVKDVAGGGFSDLASLGSLFGSNDNLSRDAESTDRQCKIFGIFSKKVQEGLDAIRQKNRELIHNEVNKVEGVIFEQLPECLKTPLQSSVKNVMSDRGTLTRDFDLSSVFTPIIGALAEPAQDALRGLYTETHRGIEDNLAKMSEDAIVSRVKKYLPFIDFGDNKN